jgi:CspA family cold shock protein
VPDADHPDFAPSLATVDKNQAGRSVRCNQSEEESMATGTVKWFSDDKGFGFITPDESGQDLFVHHTGIAGQGFRSLDDGQRVSFDAEAGDKGPKAVNVQAI